MEEKRNGSTAPIRSAAVQEGGRYVDAVDVGLLRERCEQRQGTRGR